MAREDAKAPPGVYLTKRVCIACRKEYAQREAFASWVWDAIEFSKHGCKSDTELWEIGMVDCPYKKQFLLGNSGAELNVMDGPPSWCKYILEHIVGENRKPRKRRNRKG